MGRALRGAGPTTSSASAGPWPPPGSCGLPGRRIAAGPLARPPGAPWAPGHGWPTWPGWVAAVTCRPPPADDAECAVVFTSGATGPAKGVVYRHRQVQAQLRRAAHDLRPHRRRPPGGRVRAVRPLGPALGIASAVPDMDVTAPGTLTAAALADAVAAVDATVVFASPAALRNVVATAADLTAEHRAALGGVRLLLSAGAPGPCLRCCAAVRELLPHADAHTPYGMTEALPVTDITLDRARGRPGPATGSASGRRCRASAWRSARSRPTASSEADPVTDARA